MEAEDVRSFHPISFHNSHKKEDLQSWLDENPHLLNKGQPMVSLVHEIKIWHGYYIDNLFIDTNAFLNNQGVGWIGFLAVS